MSPEEREALRLYEQGERLQGLVESPAWETILSILQDEVLRAENKLLTTSSQNEGEILSLFHRARAQRDLMSAFKNTVNELIEGVNNPPAIVQQTRPY